MCRALVFTAFSFGSLAPRMESWARMPLLPISSLLSQLLVACTIEFDNAAELQIPHVTTRHSASTEKRGPWLVSMAMGLNCMLHLPDEGITLRELLQCTRTPTNLPGMQRWGYIKIIPPAGHPDAAKPHLDSILRPTRWGRIAQRIWKETAQQMQPLWEQRYGPALRTELQAFASNMSPTMPACMPILHHGLWTFDRARKKDREALLATPYEANARLDTFLPVLLARILLHFAAEYEAASHVSLAIGANVLRVIPEEGVLTRDLPRLSGVSKEAIAMALGWLEKHGRAEVESGSRAQRSKAVVLTEKGMRAAAEYDRLTHSIESRWTDRFGFESIAKLRAVLEPLVKPGFRGRSPLFAHLEPDPDNWRAKVPAPEQLPHYPMVLHRGGFPDGS